METVREQRRRDEEELERSQLAAQRMRSVGRALAASVAADRQRRKKQLCVAVKRVMQKRGQSLSGQAFGGWQAAAAELIHDRLLMATAIASLMQKMDATLARIAFVGFGSSGRWCQNLLRLHFTCQDSVFS